MCQQVRQWNPSEQKQHILSDHKLFLLSALDNENEI